MARVVSDCGPLRYLVLIGEAVLLPRLFGQVSIPEAVHAELCHLRAPAAIRGWIAAVPDWLAVVPTPAIAELPLPSLDIGERAAIALAQSCRADLILMDDRAGVLAARGLGLATVGTIGVLDLAARRGLVGFVDAITRLKATNFRVRPDVLDALMARHGA